MTASRLLGVGALVIGLAAVTTGPAQAATRINGNQMVEGLGSWGFDFQATARGATAAVDQRSYRIFTSLGQGVIAQGTLPDSVAAGGGNVSLAIGVGLAYDILRYNPVLCPVATTGDVDASGAINLADVIYLVNYVYKAATGPAPCRAVADVNCTGEVTTSDLMLLIAYVFKGGTPPCDVCDLIPDPWTCSP